MIADYVPGKIIRVYKYSLGLAEAKVLKILLVLTRDNNQRGLVEIKPINVPYAEIWYPCARSGPAS